MFSPFFSNYRYRYVKKKFTGSRSLGGSKKNTVFDGLGCGTLNEHIVYKIYGTFPIPLKKMYRYRVRHKSVQPYISRRRRPNGGRARAGKYWEDGFGCEGSINY
jgi:hypothetical protein